MASAVTDFAALGFSYPNETSTDAFNDAEDDRIDEANFVFMDVCPCMMHDIIILAEFSEIKGPIPILTIPSSNKNELNIDVDDFILKIMSVDYQANSSGHFQFTSDTQVLQTDVIDGVHAYIHYFSLNDIAARGFVRPLCLAYISKNRPKLETNMPFLREQFLKVSTSLKNENRTLFLEEISLSLQYLKDIQYRYFQWKQRLEENVSGPIEEDNLMLNISIEQLFDQKEEYNRILESARLISESEEVRNSLGYWRSGFFNSAEIAVEEYVTFVKRSLNNRKPVLLCQKSNANCSNLHSLKPIAAISPFGFAIGVWKLCLIHENLNRCILESVGGCFWMKGSQADGDLVNLQYPNSVKQDVMNALSSAVFHDLIVQLIPNKAIVAASRQSDLCLLSQENVDPNVILSGNEASSSYYSAPESVTEIVSSCMTEPSTNTSQLEDRKKCQSFETCNSSASSESLTELGASQEKPRECIKVIPDNSSSDSSEYLEQNESEVFEYPTTQIWSNCVWSGNVECPPNHPGLKILQFFEVFSKVAQHILYSVLVGRTVVIAGSSNMRRKVLEIISAVVYFVPVPKDSFYLRWHRGILVSAHIEKYKVIGLCIPERLTVHDMISPRDKNYVTILDVNTKQIFGPAYSGQLLSSLEENFHKNFLSEESLLLFIQTVFMNIHEKVFIYKVCSSGSSQTSGKNQQKASTEVLGLMDIKGCDTVILKNLKKLSISQ